MTLRTLGTSTTSITKTVTSRVARGNGYIGAGDSLSTYQYPGNIPNWTTLVDTYTNGRLRTIANAGVAGNTTTQLLARLQTDVIAYNPALVTVLIGTNNVPGGSFATFKSDITAIHDALRAAGIISVVCTIPPRNDGSGYLSTIATWNAWLKYFAATTDRPLLALHSQLVDPSTGLVTAAYDFGNNPHFNAAGNAAMARYAAPLLSALVPPYTPIRAGYNADANNLLPNGLFLLGGSPNPTSWTPAGGGGFTSAAYEALVTDSDFRGKAWKWTIPTGTSPADAAFRQLQALCTSVPAVGDTIEVQMKVKLVSSEGMAQGRGLAVSVIFNGASTGSVQYLTQGVDGTGDLGTFSKRFVVPSGTTGVYVNASVNPAINKAITAAVGEPAVFNLTAMGLV